MPYHNHKKIFSFIKFGFFLRVRRNRRANIRKVFLLVENRFQGNDGKFLYFAPRFENLGRGRTIFWNKYEKLFQSGCSFLKIKGVFHGGGGGGGRIG